MHISRSFPLIQHNQGYLHPAGALSTYFIGNYEVELAFHSTRSYAAQRAASRPRLNRWARIQFGRVHSGMFSMSRFYLRHSAQIGLNLLCHPSWEKFDTDETWQTPHQHNIWIITMFRPSERSGSWTLVVEDCQPGDSGSYRCQVRESCVCLSVFSSRLLVSEISNPILCLWTWFFSTLGFKF